ncbi:MAG: hypothetical protein LKI59_08125 [Bacteroidales bacterium]|jgi:hypothetical protein|nr:hypothetical protein [Bacteroidales bacterium]
MEDKSTLLTRFKRLKGEYLFFASNDSLLARFSEIIFDGPGKSSLKFNSEPEEFFCIPDDKLALFVSKEKEACSGSGTSEMRTLRSSSLLCLACFYDLPNNPLSIRLNGKDYIFSESFFEIQNTCVNGGKSNVDVVLVGKESSGKSMVLFLESKFAEYLSFGKVQVSNKKESYQKLFEGEYRNVIKGCNLTLNITEDNDRQPVIELLGEHYCTGPKQMICHHKGIINTLNSKSKSFKDPRKNYLRSLMLQSEILLGEIVFKFPGDTDSIKRGNIQISAFEDYSNIYQAVYNGLSGLSPNVTIIDKLLTYQEVFKDYPLEDKIKSFYRL